MSTRQELEENIVLENKRIEYLDIVTQRKIQEACSTKIIDSFEKVVA